jgi:hypothetical protein
MYNTGFIDTFPVRIDLGRLRQNPAFTEPTVFGKDLAKIAIDRVDEWTRRHFPQYREAILIEMQAKLHSILSAP